MLKIRQLSSHSPAETSDVAPQTRDFLTDYGFDFDSEQTTTAPLFLAAQRGMTEVIAALLARGENPAVGQKITQRDPHTTHISTKTPYGAAREAGHTQAARLLTKAGGDKSRSGTLRSALKAVYRIETARPRLIEV